MNLLGKLGFFCHCDHRYFNKLLSIRKDSIFWDFKTVQTKNKFFDDLAKLGQSAAGTVHGVKHEIDQIVKQKLESLLLEMDLVTRDEYEVLVARVDALVKENSDLHKKLEELNSKREE